MRTIAVRVLLSALLTLGSSVAVAQTLCPVAHKPAAEEEADQLNMQEAEFHSDKALEAVEWLEKDVWDVIRRSKTTEELMSDTEGFGIPFPNSVAIAKGAILREQALVEQGRLELVKLKRKDGTATDAQVSAADRRFKEARRAFCRFLKQAQYVD